MIPKSARLRGYQDGFLSLKKGFTLIELLVVIAIVGVLASAVLVAINPAERIAEARDSQTKNDIGSIATGLTTYYTRKLVYPQSTTGTAACTGTTSGLCLLAQSTGDLKIVPTPPQAGNSGAPVWSALNTRGGANTCTSGIKNYDCGYELASNEVSVEYPMFANSNNGGGSALNVGVWCFRSVTGQAGIQPTTGAA